MNRVVFFNIKCNFFFVETTISSFSVHAYYYDNQV